MRYDGSYEQWEKEAQRSPFSFGLKVVFAGTLLLMACVAGCVVLGVFSTTAGVAHEAATVVREEFGPRALLQKYEWFKDASAALDKKLADVKVYQGRQSAMLASYDGAARKTWAREDREQLSIWMSEAAGIKASYNQLAAEYNAKMAKFNWRFTNVGGLPQGATQPLPREYKPYVEE